MQKEFRYSVAIRTLGTAGEKYEKLLASIRAQTIAPEAVIVVLPHGFTPPAPILGTEEFVFSDKGMVPQRLAALDHVRGDYVLFCDDDVELIPTFMEKLSDALLRGYDCAAGPLLSFFPPKGLLSLIGSAVGEASIMLRGRDHMYVRILGTGGFSYNDSIDLAHHRIYDTDSLPGTCFCASIRAMREVQMDEELWLEKNGFAAWEDRVMLSKLIVNGHKACVVSDASYEHNDGKTSVKKLKLEPIFARGFNHYVYWHRFLYMPAGACKRLWLRLCIDYYDVMFRLYLDARILMHQTQKAEKKAWHDGMRAGRRFTKSDEYRAIPPAKK